MGDDDFINLSDAQDETLERISGDTWWGGLLGDGDRRGFVRGSSILLGGEPGAGKSTFSLHAIDQAIEDTGQVGVYLAIEEMAGKIKPRAYRIGCRNVDKIMIPKSRITPDLEILEAVANKRPCFTVFDSLTRLAGRDMRLAVTICERLATFAQDTNTVMLIVDHVVKGESFAGFMDLQHEVDVTVYLRADPKKRSRTWETIKNRHGEGFVTQALFLDGTGLHPSFTEDEVIEAGDSRETDGNDFSQ